MKKEYIQPTTAIVETELMTIIATSPQTMNISSDHADEELSNNRRGGWGDLWSE